MKQILALKQAAASAADRPCVECKAAVAAHRPAMRHHIRQALSPLFGSLRPYRKLMLGCPSLHSAIHALSISESFSAAPSPSLVLASSVLAADG